MTVQKVDPVCPVFQAETESEVQKVCEVKTANLVTTAKLAIEVIKVQTDFQVFVVDEVTEVIEVQQVHKVQSVKSGTLQVNSVTQACQVKSVNQVPPVKWDDKVLAALPVNEVQAALQVKMVNKGQKVILAPKVDQVCKVHQVLLARKAIQANEVFLVNEVHLYPDTVSSTLDTLKTPKFQLVQATTNHSGMATLYSTLKVTNVLTLKI
jgi:hypothetical protein